MILLPLKYTIKARIHTGEEEKALTGCIKDLSLNGVGFILNNPVEINAIQEGAGLTLELSLHRKKSLSTLQYQESIRLMQKSVSSIKSMTGHVSVKNMEMYCLI